MTSMAACSQNDEDDQTDASQSELEDYDITLDSETSCNEMDTESDDEEYEGNDRNTDDADADPINALWLMKKALIVK